MTARRWHLLTASLSLPHAHSLAAWLAAWGLTSRARGGAVSVHGVAADRLAAVAHARDWLERAPSRFEVVP